MKRVFCSVCFLCCLLLFMGVAAPVESSAQTAGQSSTVSLDARANITHQDYLRSNGLRPIDLRGKLKNGFVTPHWIGQQDDFWYARDTARGHEFVVVEAASGRTHPAFDHQEMAQAFSKVAGSNVNAESLPFEDITFNTDRSVIHILAGGKEYDCRLAPAVCSAGKALPPPLHGQYQSPLRPFPGARRPRRRPYPLPNRVDRVASDGSSHPHRTKRHGAWRSGRHGGVT